MELESEVLSSIPGIVLPHCVSLNTEIFSDDRMYQADRHHYFTCGASALKCILHTLGLVELANPQTILDFGSGAGRVTRWLRAGFPDADIHASDIREQDLEFVRSRFNVTTRVSGTDVEALNSPVLYDMIWVGSVFTHLSAAISAKLFDKLKSWLTPKGVLVFSVHGRFVLFRANSGDNIYGLDRSWRDLMRRYKSIGFGYANYPQQDDYGISVSRTNWWVDLIESRANARLVCVAERAWDHHHDVIAIQNTDWH